MLFDICLDSIDGNFLYIAWNSTNWELFFFVDLVVVFTWSACTNIKKVNKHKTIDMQNMSGASLSESAEVWWHIKVSEGTTYDIMLDLIRSVDQRGQVETRPPSL